MFAVRSFKFLCKSESTLDICLVTFLSILRLLIPSPLMRKVLLLNTSVTTNLPGNLTLLTSVTNTKSPVLKRVSSLELIL